MSFATKAGIDYGMGLANIDHATGIRFGVINQNEVLQAWCDSSEPYYGEPACPSCSSTSVESFGEGHEEFTAYREWSCQDYACTECKHYLSSDEVYGEEALGANYDAEGYAATSGDDGDIFITKSNYYTKAKFCSPCAPGAGHLSSPSEDGVKTYCFGHDWFEDNVAPYPVYSVETDELVQP